MLNVPPQIPQGNFEEVSQREAKGGETEVRERRQRSGRGDRGQIDDIKLPCSTKKNPHFELNWDVC